MEIIYAHSPVDRQYLIGDIEAKMFDQRGGVFYSYKHGVIVIVPAGAILTGILAELKFAATLISPIPFASNKTPVSPIYWLCMDSRVELQKPIQIWLPVAMFKSTMHTLQFAKSLHSEVNIIGKQIDALEGGKFTDGECYGCIEVSHFCYYCIVRNNLKSDDIPPNKYKLIAMKQSQPSSNDKSWSVHICLVPDLRTCTEVS